MQPVKTPFFKNTRVLIVLGVIAAIILFLVIVATLAVGNSKKEEVTTQPEAAETTAPATNDDVKQSMAVLDAAMKQSDADSAAADAAIKDEGVVKVGD